MIQQQTPRDFVEAHTALLPVAFVPEIKLLQAHDMVRVWHAYQELMGCQDVDVPYWAVVWAGGQALARHILDDPEIVMGKSVLDLACGSGIGAIAAAKAGAGCVLACDTDPLAQMALALNAVYNEVDIDICGEMDMKRPPESIDVIIAGDICYEQRMSHRLLRWLMMCKEADIDVIIADPKRGYAPDRNPDVRVSALADYLVPTPLDIEGDATREVVLWNVEAYSAAS
jgi:predicted nicotinamide N-methyase